MHELLIWGGFVFFIVALLVFDLKVLNRTHHEINVRESFKWVAFWISLAIVFNAGIYYYRGADSALEFLTGYLIEYSLSVDNIFVFILIFNYFAIPPKYRHKVLFWGIVGAIVMRAMFILAGVELIERIHWIIYVFGAFLIFIGVKMAFEKEKEVHPENNPMLKLFRKFMPVTKDYHGARFFVREKGKLFATPLFVVVLVIETTDVVFAVDSIPAILSITLDRFIVYTSNIFAILGLRALYFAMAGIMPLFHYLNYGLSAILVFVGAKMLVTGYFDVKIPISVALGVVGGILLVSILASVFFPPRGKK
ncbi:MAG: TerC family protein [Spirochaetes bacterium]|nr:MAG: TerC family protein [Spirochaetota bacterium]